MPDSVVQVHLGLFTRGQDRVGETLSLGGFGGIVVRREVTKQGTMPASGVELVESVVQDCRLHLDLLGEGDRVCGAERKPDHTYPRMPVRRQMLGSRLELCDDPVAIKRITEGDRFVSTCCGGAVVEVERNDREQLVAVQAIRERLEVRGE